MLCCMGVVPYYVAVSSSFGDLAVGDLILVNNFVFVSTLEERSVILTC